MAKSPRFAASHLVIIPEATLAGSSARTGLSRFCFWSMWSDSVVGGKSLTHP